MTMESSDRKPCANCGVPVQLAGGRFIHAPDTDPAQIPPGGACGRPTPASAGDPAPAPAAAAPDVVNHPAHYSSHPSGVECITVVEHLPFLRGNAIKYLWRAGEKKGVDPREDLRKAAWYIRREIAKINREEGAAGTPAHAFAPPRRPGPPAQMLAWWDPSGQLWIAPLGSPDPDPDQMPPAVWMPVKRQQRADQ